jgi:hypothetical protein
MNRVRAISMPDIAHPVSRVSDGLVPGIVVAPDFDVVNSVSAP